MGNRLIDPRNARKVRRMRDDNGQTAKGIIVRETGEYVEFPGGAWIDPLTDKYSSQAVFIGYNEFGAVWALAADSWESAWDEYCETVAENCPENPAEDSDGSDKYYGQFFDGGNYLSECTLGYMTMRGIDASGYLLVFA